MSSIVSSITGGVGGNTGGAGLNYQAGSANLSTPTTDQQATDAYAAAQAQLANQNAFLSAVQAQNGLGNQSSVYNQLQGVANGTGPNPAQAQLAQSTGQNVANQAALMAGQRGSSANVGLMSRNIAQQGAATQQQAAGQGATLQAQQSLNALQGLGGLATSQANQQANATQMANQAAQSEQGQILGGIASQNQALVGNQSSQNSANAGIAGVAAGQQGNLIGNITGGVGSALGLAQGGMIPKYAEGAYVSSPQMSDDQWSQASGTPASSSIPNTTSTPTISSTTPQTTTTPAKGTPKSNVGKSFFKNNPNMLGDNADASKPPSGVALGGQTIGKGIGLGLKALFGKSTPTSTPQVSGNAGYMPDGLYNDSSALPTNSYTASDTSDTTATNNGMGTSMAPQDTSDLDNSQIDPSNPQAAKGGLVKAMVSPGEVYLPPSKVKKVAKGADPIKEGKKIPGKPKFPGNDYRNDVVPKDLKSGGIILPNDVMQAKHPHWEAMKFVRAAMAKNGKLPKKG